MKAERIQSDLIWTEVSVCVTVNRLLPLYTKSALAKLLNASNFWLSRNAVTVQSVMSLQYELSSPFTP